jgi:hypothetical protein
MSEHVTQCAEAPCASCPWRKSNQNKESPRVEGHRFTWYSKANQRRLWRELRNGERMTCHPTDSAHPQANGRQTPDTVQTRECAGALILVQREMMIAQAIPDKGFKRYRRSRPHGLSLCGMRVVVERVLFAGLSTCKMGRPDLNLADVQYEPLGVWPQNLPSEGRKRFPQSNQQRKDKQ